MHRQPRRVNPHPQYIRGSRLRAEDVRRARDVAMPRSQAISAGAQARVAAQAPARAGAGARPSPPRSGGAPRVASPARPATVRPGEKHQRPHIKQPRSGGRAGTPRPAPARRGWSARKKIIIGIPAFLFIAAAIVVVPLAIQARQAADKIFVDRNQSRVVVTENAEGTAVAVPASQVTATAGAPVVALPDWDKKERVNILLLGVDDRKDGEVPRSDTMILVTIDPAAKKVAMLSIPRDLLVTIPGYGNEKINAAYPYGSTSDLTGAGLARATVEYNFKIPIHYFAEVDFEGFQKIVDTIGGITIDVPAPIKDDEYPGEATNYTRVYFATGTQHMDGQRALRYARTRHDDNDFARGNRQQEVLQAMREQGVQLGLITKVPQLISDLGDTVRTDLSPTEAAALAKLGTEVKGENIQSYNLLSAVSEQSGPNQPYYLVPNWTAVRGILDEMMSGSEPPAAPAVTAPTPTPAQADLNATILVQNATQVNRLATNSAGLLEDAGFTDVTPAQAPSPGAHPKSQITDFTGNLATARRIAEILGLPQATIKRGDSSLADGNDIVVVLGEDAPVPTPRP